MLQMQKLVCIYLSREKRIASYTYIFKKILLLLIFEIIRVVFKSQVLSQSSQFLDTFYSFDCKRCGQRLGFNFVK
ncbi:hypothetical protein BpHYR1_043654 [Brachionus plicatilis]|uniref:Uncharacterized protein n=1 Tax=Brachionus plicatilis TaxID=10195 RepID=A0A3M7P835_BRAPC|nr:hypothetical protein BpHYR1_043654 [Brachionus plicatilis]